MPQLIASPHWLDALAKIPHECARPVSLEIKKNIRVWKNHLLPSSVHTQKQYLKYYKRWKTKLQCLFAVHLSKCGISGFGIWYKTRQVFTNHFVLRRFIYFFQKLESVFCSFSSAQLWRRTHFVQYGGKITGRNNSMAWVKTARRFQWAISECDLNNALYNDLHISHKLHLLSTNFDPNILIAPMVISRLRVRFE